MNNYVYKILDTHRDASGIVVSVVFRIDVSDGVDTFSRVSQTALPPPKDGFVPFSDLTELRVIAWIRDLVGEQEEELSDNELTALKSRKNIEKGVPWNL